MRIQVCEQSAKLHTSVNLTLITLGQSGILIRSVRVQRGVKQKRRRERGRIRAREMGGRERVRKKERGRKRVLTGHLVFSLESKDGSAVR